ncbi:MAG: hybrid sensor histidine kinase/response regulator [Burkholderiaceae bacterium]|nr:hybrid sensor histidine kinase/response regulator [Burkholderiaceae bacterium]
MPDTPANILIVDDLPENLLALQALIRGDGRTIHQAQSGEAALALLLEHEFALAILDVQMPTMNGFELAELMRGTERTRHIPIIFVTAASEDLKYSFQGYESGAVDFLHKPLDIQAVQGKVSVFVDLWRQKRAVRVQLEALREARREQDELVKRLREAQADLERAVRMRDDFVSAVSHELRTPLHTLFLEVQMRRVHLGRGDAEALSPRNMEAMVQREERQIQSMVRLIDDMIDVSRLRGARLVLRTSRVQLKPLVERAVDSLSHQASEAGVSFALGLPADLVGQWDEFRIEQVFSNLIGNALRHAPGSPITVRAVLAAGPDGQAGARIDVRDQGPGIPPIHQERVFGQFERAVGNDGPPGMGLGLYIAREVVQAHGGSLTLRSEPGKGATFSVWLPIEAQG